MRLQSGKKYKVHYQIPGIHKKPREMVALFLSTDEDSLRGKRMYIFSGRPEFGTTELDADHIIDYDEVDRATKCYHSRKNF